MSPAASYTATSLNPATGATIATYPFHTRDDVERLLDANTAAFHLWRATPMDERVATYRRLAATLRARAEPLAALITCHSGKFHGITASTLPIGRYDT